MDTVDISKYFPLTSDAQLSEFMNPDAEWNQRRKESINIIIMGTQVLRGLTL